MLRHIYGLERPPKPSSRRTIDCLWLFIRQPGDLHHPTSRVLGKASDKEWSHDSVIPWSTIKSFRVRDQRLSRHPMRDVWNSSLSCTCVSAILRPLVEARPSDVVVLSHCSSLYLRLNCHNLCPQITLKSAALYLSLIPRSSLFLNLARSAVHLFEHDYVRDTAWL